jgi:uncharacterized membrane protein
MNKNRLEAFSDGVLAVAITIMVLELKVPHGAEMADLAPLVPVFLCYVLSFIFVGIYWTNHHHMLHAVKHVDGPVLWANLHLLFWLSMIPFTAGWMGENHFSSWPVATYGFVLLMAAIAYSILVHALTRHGRNPVLAAAMGKDFKGKISIVLYVVAIPFAFVNTWIACALYVAVAIMWLVPDRRIEKALTE